MGTTDEDFTERNRLLVDRLAELGRALTPEQWHAPSLCEGWRICDVYGHMTFGAVTPLRRVLPTLLFTYRGNLTRGSAVESAKYATAHAQRELLDEFERGHRQPVGIGRRIKPHELFVDHEIHELDVRRPLGIASGHGPGELAAALDAACRVKSPLFAPAKRASGLRLIATDIDWTAGAGLEVRGRAEDLLLALGGRPAGRAGLDGPGVDRLAER